MLVLLAGPSGGGCWYKAKCEMLLRKIDGEMNVQNCEFFAKWRWWQHAPRLMATAVITDSRCRFSKRWHVADVKNIAGDDHTTLMVHRNSANIVCTFRIYVCAIAAVVPRLTVAAVATHLHRRISKRWHITDFKNHWRWPGNPNGRSKFRNLGLFTYTRSQLTLRRRLRSWWRLPEIAQTARCRRQKHRRRWPWSIEIPQIRKFMPTWLSKTSRKTSFCCYEWRCDWRDCAPFTFLLSLATAFVFTFEK